MTETVTVDFDNTDIRTKSDTIKLTKIGENYKLVYTPPIVSLPKRVS